MKQETILLRVSVKLTLQGNSDVVLKNLCELIEFTKQTDDGQLTDVKMRIDGDFIVFYHN